MAKNWRKEIEKAMHWNQDRANPGSKKATGWWEKSYPQAFEEVTRGMSPKKVEKIKKKLGLE